MQAQKTSASAAHRPEFTSPVATKTLLLDVGKSALLDTPDQISRISMGSGEIAEAKAVSPTEVLVNAKAVGETSLVIWEVSGERQFYNVSIRLSNSVANDRLSVVRRQFDIEFPGQAIDVMSENDLLFLRGTVKDLSSSQRAVQIASTMGKVVNLLYVAVPDAPKQILLKVRFASVDRSLTKNLCWNLFSTGATNTIGSVSTQACSTPIISSTGSSSSVTATVSNALDIFLFRQDLNLGATIQALEANGLAEVLAEPNVLAENGKEASFLAGGEYPYPVLQGTGGTGAAGITIAFKEFGVRLNFIPTITPRGTIQLQVAPEVSALDFTNGLTISGFVIPALTVRRVRTEVELNDGQSFAIGGLLDNRETETFSKVPYLGSIPILGKLFQSITKTKTNTELIVIVTPELVAPIPVGTPVPSLKYPVEFLPSNSGIPMTTPGASVTGLKPSIAAPTTMPIEKLIESLKPERPLIIESSTSTSGSYGGNTNQVAPSAPPATAPQ